MSQYLLYKDTGSSLTLTRLFHNQWQQVDDAEYKNPDTINEVPVKLRSLYRKVLLLAKMSIVWTNQTDEQEEDTNRNVKAVEAG